jgi:TPR repeat protein
MFQPFTNTAAQRLAAAALLALSLLAAPLLAAQGQTPLTTLCVGLPECDQPGGKPAQPAQPDLPAPAQAALGQEEYATALRLLAPLAEAGSAEAQYRLGDLFYKGQGTAVNYLAAGKWYARAAEQLGSDWAPEAQFNLALMHAAGQGMPVDLVGALMWLEIAVASGSDLALEDRALLSARLEPEEVARAKDLARQWLAQRGK